MPFRMILDTLVAAHQPAMRAAIFCDHEGERVDASCGDMQTFDVDVIGASMAVAAAQMPRLGRLRVVVGDDAYWVMTVDLGYYLVIICRRGHDLQCTSEFQSVADALMTYM